MIQQRDLPVELKLKKTDESGAALSGAKLSVTGIFGTDTEESTRTFTTGGDGTIDLIGLVNECNTVSGTGSEFIYKLTEEEAPDGYEKLSGTVYFRLISTEQTDGIPASELEVLSGSGQTPESLLNYLSVGQDSSDEDVEVLQIKDPKTPTATPTETLTPTPAAAGSSASAAESITATPTAAANTGETTAETAKTGDSSNAVFWLYLMLASGMIIALTARRKKKKQ